LDDTLLVIHENACGFGFSELLALDDGAAMSTGECFLGNAGIEKDLHLVSA
jgi:hypothetical protein